MVLYKYLSLYESLLHDIESGKYPGGTKLPSKRIMSDRTGYSIVTVESAYTMLADEGYILPKERYGYFVSDNIRTENSIISDRIQYRLPEPGECTAAPLLETSVWFKTIRKVMADYGNILFQKAPTEGCPILRNAIADYLGRYRGINADPRRIIIGSGAEQLYETAVKLLGRTLTYGIESPCYQQIPAVYDGMGVKVCPLPLGEDGISTEALENNPVDVLHVTPFRSFPSGITTSQKKRESYLAWAESKHRYIIEDDFNSEFFQPGHPIKTLLSQDTTSSVLYLNTFSKSISPSIRIGYMILPDALLPVYREKFSQLSCTVPVMDQYVLAEFIRSGSFERHLNRIRRKINR